MVFNFLPGILGTLEKADDSVFDLMTQKCFLRPNLDLDHWFVLLTGALHIAAGESDATRPPELGCLEL